jgi:hypothetical protein
VVGAGPPYIPRSREFRLRKRLSHAARVERLPPDITERNSLIAARSCSLCKVQNLSHFTTWVTPWRASSSRNLVIEYRWAGNQADRLPAGL